MIVNTAQGGGGGVKLNLFAQPDEPPEKEGLWVQTPEKHAVKQITTRDETFAISGEWDNISFSDGLGRAEFSKSYYVFGTKAFILYQDINPDPDGFHAVVFDSVTKTSTIVHTFNGNSIECTKVMYKMMDGESSVLEMRYIEDAYSGYYIQRATFNFDTNEFVVTDNSSLFNENPFSYSQYCATAFAGTDSDGFTYWIYNKYPQSENGEDGFGVAKVDFVTNTRSLISTFSNSPSITSTGGDPSPGFIFDKIICMRLGTSRTDNTKGHFYRIDTTTHAVTDLGLHDGYGGRDIVCATSGKVFFPFSERRLSIYDIATNTWANTPSASTGVDGRIFIGFPDKVCALSAGFGSGSNTYHIISETLQSNVLAITNGRSYRTKIITTTNINAIPFWFANVWWYDTDFREYPTYIGDGTQWNKIKN